MIDELYAAVLAEPDSDEPRLVLADALQSAGDPRGELITVQCELARLGCGHTRLDTNEMDDPYPERDRIAEALLDDDRIPSLRDRERALLDEHRERWAEGIFRTHRFHRGFVDHAGVPSVTDVRAIFDRARLLRSLELWAATPAQLEDPRLAQLRHFGVGLDAVAERWFFEETADKLAHVRSLQVFSDRPIVSKIGAMSGSASLEALAIYGHDLAGLEELLEVAAITDLRIARGTREVSREAALRLAACPAARRIETLVLTGCEMRHEIASIVRSPHFQNVRILRASEDGYDWLTVTLPAIAESLPRLRVLDLSNNNLADHLRGLLIGSFPELRVLRLGYSRIDAAAIRRLVMAPIIAHLRVLDLRVTLASNLDIVNALLVSTYRPPLEYLVLPNPVEPALVHRLRAKFPNVDVETEA